jgi:gluconolactonase
VVVKSDGTVWFTDPTYGILTDYEGYKAEPEQDACHVFRVDPATAEITSVADDFVKPNGLAFTPDESALYIGDSQARVIWRYAVGADGWLGDRALFVDQRNDSRRGAPDGMKVDTDGRLWTTGAGGVSVHAADGTYLGVFEMDEHAANLTFGGPNYSTLFMTAGTSVYSIETKVRGIVPGSR